MSLRVIFAPLTGRKSDKSVLATAASAANRFNAHIDIVSVRADPRDAIPYLGEGLSGALVEELIARAGFGHPGAGHGRNGTPARAAEGVHTRRQALVPQQ